MSRRVPRPGRGASRTSPARSPRSRDIRPAIRSSSSRCRGSLARCWWNGACTPSGSRTRTPSPTGREGPPCSSTRAPTSAPLAAAVEAWGVAPEAVLRTHSARRPRRPRGRAARALRDSGGPHGRRAASAMGGLRLRGNRHPGALRTTWWRSCSTTRPCSPETCCSRTRSAAATSRRCARSVIELHGAARVCVVCPATPTRRRSAGSDESNPFIRVWRGDRAGGERAGTVAGRGCDTHGLVAGLRRQGQGLGAFRRRRGRDRRRLPCSAWGNPWLPPRAPSL